MNSAFGRYRGYAQVSGERGIGQRGTGPCVVRGPFPG